jgi:hypothetical protein
MKHRGPVLDQNRADAVVVCGSQRELRQLREYAPEVKRCVLWDEDVDPTGVKVVRLFSRERQSEPPRLLTSAHLNLDALGIESHLLPILEGCPCVSTIRHYIQIVGEGKRARIPKTVCAPRLAALWVVGVRTRVDFEPSQFPSLDSLQLCLIDTDQAFDRVVEMLQRLTTFGARGPSDRYFGDSKFCSGRVTYLRVLSSNIRSLEWLERFPRVEVLHFQSCPRLVDVNILQLLNNLQEVRFWWCPGVKESQHRFEEKAFTVDYVGTSSA